MAVLFDLKGSYWKDPEWFVECVQKEARQDAASLGSPARLVGQVGSGRSSTPTVGMWVSHVPNGLFPFLFKFSFKTVTEILYLLLNA